MQSILMYIYCTVIWGSNFLAIKIQGDTVPLETSLFYRLLIATFLFGIFSFERKRIRIGTNIGIDVLFFGALNFCISYLLLYYSTSYISSFLVAVVFSLKTIFTPIVLRIFSGCKLDKSVIIGGIISSIGIVILFLPQLATEDDVGFMAGFILAISGTIAASLGDHFSAKISLKKVDPVTSNMLGFLGATALLFVYIWIKGIDITYESSLSYIGSLVYLAVFASFFAWLFYLNLVREIGAAKSSYMVAMFPVVGVLVSILSGELEFSLRVFIGCAICIMGSFIALMPNQMESRQKGRGEASILSGD